MSTHDDILAEDQDGRIRSENSINNVMNQDPVPILTPGSGIQDGGKISGSGTGWTSPIYFRELGTIFWVKNT